jgi:hypothetical protein
MLSPCCTALTLQLHRCYTVLFNSTGMDQYKGGYYTIVEQVNVQVTHHLLPGY